MVIEHGQQENDQEWPGQHAKWRDDGAGNALIALADHHRKIDDVGSRQKLAQTELCIELLCRHPAPLFDQHAPGKGQHTAETGQPHRGKAEKQRHQIRLDRLRRCFQDQDSRRNSADLAWAGRPSPCASVEAIRPSVCAPAFDTLIKLVRFWKS